MDIEQQFDQVVRDATVDAQGNSETQEPVEEPLQPQPVDQIEAGEAAPQYQPTFKYKYEGKEFEFDDMFKGLVKDEETERQIREIHEIRQAFPKYKESYQEFTQIKPHYEGLVGELEELSQLRQSNMKEFLSRLQLDEETMIKNINPQTLKKHLAEMYAYEDLTPEQRAAYDRQKQVERDRETYFQQAQQTQRELLELKTQQRTYELEQTMGTSEVKTFQERFDSYYGNGAFQNEVIQTGQTTFKLHGRDLNGKEAVEMVMKKFGPLLNQGGQQTVQSSQGQKVRVIPNVTSRPASPGKQQVKSLADIKRIAASFED